MANDAETNLSVGVAGESIQIPLPMPSTNSAPISVAAYNFNFDKGSCGSARSPNGPVKSAAGYCRRVTTGLSRTNSESAPKNCRWSAIPCGTSVSTTKIMVLSNGNASNAGVATSAYRILTKFRWGSFSVASTNWLNENNGWILALSWIVIHVE